MIKMIFENIAFKLKIGNPFLGLIRTILLILNIGFLTSVSVIHLFFPSLFSWLISSGIFVFFFLATCIVCDIRFINRKWRYHDILGFYSQKFLQNIVIPIKELIAKIPKIAWTIKLPNFSIPSKISFSFGNSSSNSYKDDDLKFLGLPVNSSYRDIEVSFDRFIKTYKTESLYKDEDYSAKDHLYRKILKNEI